MGTRRTVIATFQEREQRVRVQRLAPLPPQDTIVPCRPGEFDGLPLWQDDVECADGGMQLDLSAALHTPEPEGWLDFSAVLPTVAILERWEDTGEEISDLYQAYRAAPQAPPRAVGLGRRIRQTSVRLAELGSMRPVVRVPGYTVEAQQEAAGAAPRTAQLPPIWLLANVAILLAVGLAVLPRVLPADAAAGCRWYSVKPGDTLGNLGWANHSTALKLAAANNIKNPDLIYVGQRLCIPMTSGAHATSSSPKAPTAPSRPSFGSAKGVKAFISFVLPYANRAHQQTGWPTSLILAQWGVEQGWHTPTYTGFNFGNCGAMPGEPTIAGINVPGSPAAFAFARTPEDGLRQYVHVAHLGYYSQVAPVARRYGVDASARALGRSPWDAGHYTHVGDPGSTLLSVLRTFNLYWYDSH
jgi:LysM repeat protein